jgi:F-type H+-transporting ATPase subunit delta
MAQLSTRYATALFELAVEQGTLDVIFDQAAVVRDAFKDDECQKFINHPNIPKTEKYKFLDSMLAKIFPNGLHTDFKGFLHLLITKSRENAIVSAIDGFIKMANNHKRLTTAKVVSAVPLSAAQVALLKSVLSQKIGKQVEIDAVVDASLIGGFYINVDGFQADRSVKNQLNDMKEFVVKQEGLS